MARLFRLQTVAQLREAQRDAARSHLADAIRASELLREKQEELAERFRSLLEQRREATSTVSPGLLLDAGRYSLVLKAEERALAENLKKIEAEIEKRRGLLADADREVRVIDKLRERDEAQQRREEQRREDRRLDEHASQQAFRNAKLANLN